MLDKGWKVRHRIDGLEKKIMKSSYRVMVRHRIDGLENCRYFDQSFRYVRHRIDGLETVSLDRS